MRRIYFWMEVLRTEYIFEWKSVVQNIFWMAQNIFCAGYIFEWKSVAQIPLWKLDFDWVLQLAAFQASASFWERLHLFGKGTAKLIKVFVSVGMKIQMWNTQKYKFAIVCAAMWNFHLFHLGHDATVHRCSISTHKYKYQQQRDHAMMRLYNIAVLYFSVIWIENNYDAIECTIFWISRLVSHSWSKFSRYLSCYLRGCVYKHRQCQLESLHLIDKCSQIGVFSRGQSFLEGVHKD